MAARSHLNILLLWAAIATLASSASETTAVAPTTSTKTAASTNTTASVLTMNLTSAPPKLSDTPSNAPAQPWNCSYTLVPIQFGFSISINFSSPETFNLTLVDESQTSESRVFNSQAFNVTYLKPCTRYSHQLSFMSDNRLCEYLGSNSSEKTRSMEISDFKDAQIIEDKVCYKSKWNIPDCQRDPKHNDLCCIKYNDTDICTNFMKSVSSNCNSSITLRKIIDLDPSKITVENKKKYPAELIATFPTNCNNWAQNYTCSEKESPHGRLYLSQLEPYKNYNCTGTFTHDLLKTVTKTDIDVRTDCKLQLNNIGNSTTSSSVDLSWSLSSSVCEGPLTFTYTCSCSPHRQGDNHILDVAMPQNLSCQLSGLHAYTSYTCLIRVRYKSKDVALNSTSLRTTEGTPEKPKVKLTVKDRNGIYVTWDKVDVHGPRTEYTVYLYEGGSRKAKGETSSCSYEFKGLSYSTEYRVEVVTYNGRFSSESSENINTFYNDKPLIGFLVFLIILTSVALSVVTYKIYILRRERSRDSSESMNLISKTNDEERLMFVEPMTAEGLLDAYKRKMADEGRLFLDEFQSIPRIFSKYTVKEAKKIHNVPKNRYVDILPYDYNRVQLTSGNGSAGCDYINASFIDGFKETKKYIAAQGPKEETVGDFWRMIWEQQASIIVMVSRCEEGNRVKCAQYWPSPDRDTEIFEEFIIKMSSEEKYPDYIIRHLTLSNKRDKGAEREVTHVQFMSWPDHGVPEEAHLLLKLRRRVNSFNNFFSGPIVIHCSAGVGRTGTYIGIDAMMESLEAEGRVDIYGYVATLRRQRCLMVQVEAQYILIHQALLEHTQFGETESPLQELHSTLNTLKQRSSDNESTLLEDEFDRLPSFKNWRTFNIGTTEENKKKNRSSSVIPYDYNRVLLKLDEGHSHESDPDDDYEMSSEEDNEDAAMYINASLISGYWGPQAFVVAQTPLPNTVADFWAMIVQLEVSAVVMLSDSHTEQDCLYWGEDKKRFEDIEVELESTDVCPSFTLRTMLVHHVKTKASQQVKHFQFLKWGNREVPEKAQDLLDLIRGIEHKCGLTLPWKTPVLVHCNDGSSRSGVLCGLWNLLDSAKKEETVDVFQVVKTLRKERQRMFSSLEQYQFLYEALEVTFPVQNGDVKAAQNSVQIVNETRAAERPCSTTSTDQQEAKESADGDVSAATEEEVSNGSTVTVEV